MKIKNIGLGDKIHFEGVISHNQVQDVSEKTAQHLMKLCPGVIISCLDPVTPIVKNNEIKRELETAPITESLKEFIGNTNIRPASKK